MVTPNGKRKRKIVLWSLFAFILSAIVYGIFYIHSLLPIITGYSSKYLCSAVFISNRQQAEVEALDLNFSFISYVTNKVDIQDSSVTSTFLWGKSKAIYREGFGSTLLRNSDETSLKKIKFPKLFPSYDPDTISWPMGNRLPDSITHIHQEELGLITKKLMQDSGYNGHAFAFMVVHKGIPVMEAYQPEFNAKTRFLSWSMAKSVTNALIGVMVKEGKLDIKKPVNISDWQKDDRKQITLNDLMQMQSGLQWNEDYGTRSDVTRMLYDQPDFAGYAYKRPLKFPVGSTWYYSSGSANIVNYVIRQQINNDSQYYTYPVTHLFNKIGMPHAIFEVDSSGTYVGSSYLYATARDYARFGLLYLQDGVFNHERILPEGWVKYTTTPASHNKGDYGSMFWLNRSHFYPSVPEDMYSCNGHNGQRIFIIPSKELVVVVLGYSPKPGNVMNFDALLADILKVID